MSVSYRVELLGFSDRTREEAIAALAYAFDLSSEDAAVYVDAVPCVVRTGVDGAVAKEYTRQLLTAGADVAIVSEGSGGRVVHRVTDLRAKIARAVAAQSLPEDVSATFDAVQLTTGERRAVAAAAPVPASTGPASTSAAPRASVAEHEDEAVSEVETVYCPRCGHRQPPGDVCRECGHRFAVATRSTPSQPVAVVGDSSVPERRRSGGGDIDVFESIRGKVPAEAGQPVPALRFPTRRTSEFSLELPAARRSRKLLWLLLAAAILLVALLLATRSEPGLGPEDQLPPNAPTPPPGLRYRPL